MIKSADVLARLSIAGHVPTGEARAIVFALIDEFNAELERVTGAILERVGAHDLTDDDVATIVSPCQDCEGCGMLSHSGYVVDCPRCQP